MEELAKTSEVSIVEARLQTETPFKLNQRSLLVPYLLVPLMVFLPIVDTLFFAGTLTKRLPDSPEVVFWITIFFIFPHIVASSLIIVNKDYFPFYKKKIALGIFGSLIIGIGIPLTLGYIPLLIVFGILTVNHVIGQQVGLTRTGLKDANAAVFQLWKWSGLILGNFAYMYIYFKSSWMPMSRELFLGVAAAIIALNGIFFVQIFRRARDFYAKLFVTANQCLLITIVLLSAFDYSFFAILVPRVIHDVSAFMVYLTHDKNRLLANVPNILSTKAKFSFIPQVITTPLAALILAFPITYFSNDYYGEIVAIVFALFHYYSESFMWKRGSLLRKYVPLG